MEGFIFGLTCYQNMLSYINVNSTHRKTLKLIFDKTVVGSLKWQRIEALFLALGAQAIEGRGSRVRFELMVWSPPFIGPIHTRRQSRTRCAMRKFLEQAGVKP